MGEAFVRQIGMLLPAMRRDGGWRLVRQDLAVWIEGICAGWLVVVWDSGSPGELTSVEKLVELDDITAIDKIGDGRKKEDKMEA